MGDPPFKVFGNQSDDMADEGIIHSAVVSFEVAVLKLRIFVKGFESSLLPMIGCHKQPAILSLISQRIDKVGGHVKFGALLSVNKLLMEAVAYDFALVE